MFNLKYEFDPNKIHNDMEYSVWKLLSNKKSYKEIKFKKNPAYEYYFSNICDMIKEQSEFDYLVRKKEKVLEFKGEPISDFFLTKVAKVTYEKRKKDKKYYYYVLFLLNKKKCVGTLIPRKDTIDSAWFIDIFKDFIGDDIDEKTCNHLIKASNLIADIKKLPSIKILAEDYEDDEEDEEEFIEENHYDTDSNEEQIENNISIDSFENFYNYLHMLFNISKPSDTMLLFGYYLLAYYYDSIDNPNFKCSLNLVCKDKKYLKPVCTLFNQIFYYDEETVPENTTDYHTTTIDKLLNKIYKNEWGVFVVDCSVNFNKSDRAKFYDKILKILYKKRKKSNDEECHTTVIVASTSEISNDLTIINELHEINSTNLKEIKNNIGIISKSLKKFNEHMNNRLILLDFGEGIESLIKESYKHINCHTISDIKYSKKLAGIIFILNSYFEYLKEECILTEEQYLSLIEECKLIYMEEPISCNNIKSVQLSEEKPIETRMSEAIIAIELAKMLLEVYKNNKLAFSSEARDKPFIYNRCKAVEKLICFKNSLKDFVDFLNNNCAEKSEEFLEVMKFFNEKTEEKEKLTLSIKKEWKEKGFTHCSKNRDTYSMKSTYIAFNIGNIEKHFELL